jgi:DNA-binding PadR family transcriptional regulator
MNLSADLLRGYTDPIILQRLEKKDGYGYQISREVSELSGGRVELKEATLYTAFRRLETAGLIRSYWGDEQSGARRRYYAITDAGADRLRADQAAWQETKAQIDLLLLEE